MEVYLANVCTPYGKDFDNQYEINPLEINKLFTRFVKTSKNVGYLRDMCDFKM